MRARRDSVHAGGERDEGQEGQRARAGGVAAPLTCRDLCMLSLMLFCECACCSWSRSWLTSWAVPAGHLNDAL